MSGGGSGGMAGGAGGTGGGGAGGMMAGGSSGGGAGGMAGGSGGGGNGGGGAGGDGGGGAGGQANASEGCMTFCSDADNLLEKCSDMNYYDNMEAMCLADCATNEETWFMECRLMHLMLAPDIGETDHELHCGHANGDAPCTDQ